MPEQVFPPSEASETACNGEKVETAGIEPAGRSLHIPLRNRAGEIVAQASIDAGDEHLAIHRWCLDPGNRERSGKPYVKRIVWMGVGKPPLTIYLHREVLGLAPGDPRKGDHIDGNTLNCRRANLRIATTAENAQNQGSRGGTSEHRGVTWDKSRQKWMATAMLAGRRTTIGRFDTEQEAADAAAAWRAEHMPFSTDGAGIGAR